MSTPENNVNAIETNDFVGFQTVEVTAEAKGPSLPDPAAHGLVVNAEKLSAALTALGVGEKVAADFNAAIAGRGKDNGAGPGFLIISLFPIPKGNEVDVRKARKVYGAGKGLDMPFADAENNRLQLTSLLYAPVKKEEEQGSEKTTETEKDLEE